MVRSTSRVVRKKSYMRIVVEIQPWCDHEAAQNVIERKLTGLEEVSDVHFVQNCHVKSDYHTHVHVNHKHGPAVRRAPYR